MHGRLREHCASLEEKVRFLECELSMGAEKRASHASEVQRLTEELSMSLGASRLVEVRAAGAEARVHAVEAEMADLLRRMEEMAAGRNRDRNDARAMAARMGSDVAALQAAENRLVAELTEARRVTTASHLRAEARARELATLQETHTELEATSQRLVAETDSAKSAYERIEIRLETEARERAELERASKKVQEASILARAEAAECQAQLDRVRSAAEAAEARESKAHNRARAAEERVSKAYEEVEAASGCAKAATAEAHKWHMTSRQWALRALVQRKNIGLTAAKRRGFDNWRLHVFTRSLAEARSTAMGAAAEAMTANRTRLLRRILRIKAHIELRRNWALWHQIVLVSKVVETTQVAQAEQVAESKRMAEERQREELDARDKACANKLESILTENQNLSMRSASLVAEVISYRLQVQRLDQRCLNAEREATDAKQQLQNITYNVKPMGKSKGVGLRAAHESAELQDSQEMPYATSHGYRNQASYSDDDDELDASSQGSNIFCQDSRSPTSQIIHTRDSSFQWATSPLNQSSSNRHDATSSLVPPLPPGLTPHLKANTGTSSLQKPLQYPPVTDLAPKRLLR